ncbi:hypothetical protein R3P38DRAFT_2770298 [Favolaschia claudopus]|uniref:Uncharacterized protein n=1 Tax=Favolaschia claudopus TaxID=2862362 RepID=A0AAW0CHW1_9AGAR
MSSGPTNDPHNSALYQYVVPAAVFIFAAISITMFFRANARRRTPPPGIVVAVRGSRVHRDLFDPGKKPPLFDAYLEDVEGMGVEWGEMMPLAAANIDDAGLSAAAARAVKRASAASPSLSPDAPFGGEVDPQPPDHPRSSPNSSGLNLDAIPTRLLVSVVVRMPFAPVPMPVRWSFDGEGNVEPEESTPLPNLELGSLEVDVLSPAEEGVQPVT